MIQFCDDYEQLAKVVENIKLINKDQVNALSNEDRQLLQQIQIIKQTHEDNCQGFIPTQILKTFQQTPNLQQNNNDLLKNEDSIELMEKNESNSETQSLSFLTDQYSQFNLIEQQQWEQILNQYGNLFKAFKNNIIVKTNDQINKLLNKSKFVFKDQNNNNIVYLAFLIQTKEWIVVKEQKIYNQYLIDTSQQFVIHDYIYQLYPFMFLRIYLPVYIEIEQNDQLKFLSFSEQGLIDLYQYSQQKIIKNLEFQLIFQQIFQQIELLHKHNIAHRDIKPQNVIFVENKGWVLCDFENSLKYVQINGQYNIKGTYAFLIPQLQLKSKIQGIQMKQNLLKNDLYALAVTLIVIKYQITSQEQIQQYLSYPKDQLIEVLLKSDSIQDLLKYIFEYEMRFIRPQLKYNQQQIQSLERYDNQQIFEFINILGTLNQTISNELIFQILNKIDEHLKNQDSFNNYIDIICYYKIPQYVNQLKNIVNYKELRQRKYWKNIIYKQKVINSTQLMSNQIKFMSFIGLTDLCLLYAQQYISINYDFTIQIQILHLLELFENYEEAQNQFNHLLSHREFYQMNPYEQLQFLQYTFKKFEQNCNNDQMKQFLGNEIIFVKNKDLLLNNYTDEQLIEQFILNIWEIYQTDYILLFVKLNLYQDLIQDIFLVKNIQMSLKLLVILKYIIKFQCATIFWQELLKMEIQLTLLVGHHNKNLVKKMNYVILFNSESTFQQDSLKFYKFFVQFYGNSKKKSYKQKIIHKIIHQVKSLQCPNKLYQIATMQQLILIIIDAVQQNLLNEFFQVFVFIFNQQDLLGLFKCQYQYQDSFQNLIIQCFKDTRNKQRLKKIVTRGFVVANYRNMVQDNKIDMLNYQFHISQYLYR